MVGASLPIYSASKATRSLRLPRIELFLHFILDGNPFTSLIAVLLACTSVVFTFTTQKNGNCNEPLPLLSSCIAALLLPSRYLPSYVTDCSLCALGDTTLLDQHIDCDNIQLLECWHSDSMLHCLQNAKQFF